MTHRRWLSVVETSFSGRYMNHRFTVHKLVEPISQKAFYETQIYGDELSYDANHYHPVLFPSLIAAITEATCWIEEAENFTQCPQLHSEKVPELDVTNL